MIYVRFEGHDFKYEAEDIIRLFYGSEEVKYIESAPPEDYRGVFILSRLFGKTGLYSILTSVSHAGEVVYQNNVDTNIEANENTPVIKEKLRKLKREVKHQLYIAFSNITGMKMPWGMLTGIRPAKIVHELLETGHSRTKIIEKLTGYHLVTEDKARLLYEIAVTEKGILQRTTPDMISLYIGVPFCTTRCLYCSFTSNPIGKSTTLINCYMKALEHEIRSVSDIIKKRSFTIQSIYIGGGTPTSIDADALGRLLDHIDSSFNLDGLQEFTLEAGRPDTITEEKLRVIKNSRVDRISINPQTMNDDTLNVIGRAHTAEDIKNAFNMARGLGFENINMDVIAGLPGEDIRMFEHTMKEIKEMGPDSLTVHTMAVKRASKLNSDREKYVRNSSLEVEEMIKTASGYAQAIGLRPYYLYRQKNMVGNLENIGYSKPGLESIYNIQIMEERQSIIALGAGAITKVVYPDEDRMERAFNVKNVEEYINRVDEMVERKRSLL